MARPYEVTVIGVGDRQRARLPVFLWEADIDPWQVLKKACRTWPGYRKYIFRGVSASAEELADPWLDWAESWAAMGPWA